MRATDAGGLSFDKTFTIAIGNVNEAPASISLSNTSVAENSAINTVVGAFSAFDPENNIVAGAIIDNPGNLFALSEFNLVVNGALDFEAAPSRTITVRATDAGGLTLEKNFTIAIGNVNERPTDIALSNASVAENSGVNAVIGALSGSDPEGNTLNWSLVGNPGSLFAISGNNLVVNGVLDFEAASSAASRCARPIAAGLPSTRASRSRSAM